LEECWPCLLFAGFTLAFALQLRKKYGKTSIRVAEEIQSKYGEEVRIWETADAAYFNLLFLHPFVDSNLKDEDFRKPGNSFEPSKYLGRN
jgi:hypothetical protein